MALLGYPTAVPYHTHVNDGLWHMITVATLPPWEPVRSNLAQHAVLPLRRYHLLFARVVCRLTLLY
jgi:hypothetical protein